jgi:hypothetical protein
MPVRPVSDRAKPLPERMIALLNCDGSDVYPVCRGECGEALLCDRNWVPLLDVTDAVPTGWMVVDKITYCVLHDILWAWLAGIEYGRAQLDREICETLRPLRADIKAALAAAKQIDAESASTGMTDAELAS